ncbi:hypothetical protein HPO96_09430 [Kribbella sandramycini]|uniref:Circularly permuted ATP-grasp superfamily protein n=1 Tax=Kribbella sandramycini TaxID=60450 RepID=A0A7Y4KXJ7_9ACTN|nr:hypothetical protein [Kribbella sandramycini]MBB6569705.1 hypothetical protein [Kribbella sandramycini]NOL40465.1 hypothetical protein [Kribbella sandramycini]
MSLTDSYLAAAAERGPKPSEVRAAAAPRLEATGYGGRCLSRPVFLEAAEHRRLTEDLGLVHQALTSIPDRLFGGDIVRFAQAAGLAEAQAVAVSRGRGPAPSRFGRADLYRDEHGFWLLELNLGSTAGGVDNAVLNEAMLEHPFIADFVRDNELTYTETMAQVVKTILVEAKVPTGVRPVMAIADFPDSYPSLATQLHKSAAALAPLGIDALACPVDELEYRDDRIWHGDRAIDIVFRLFMIEDLLKPGAVELLEPVLQASERGHVAIFTPLDAELYGSKSALAILSDDANRSRFRPEEQEAIDRLVPWTRMVRPDLLDYAKANQSELVLKPAALHGGAGVLLGWQTDPETWSARLAEAAGRPWVLQRRIQPVPESFPTDTAAEDWLLTWGAFLVHEGLGGYYVRGTENLDGGVINLTMGATGTCCFYQQ